MCLIEDAASCDLYMPINPDRPNESMTWNL